MTTDWQIPHVVYQPDGCIIRNSNISGFRYSHNNQPASMRTEPLAFADKYSFPLFFQHLLRSILSVKVITTSVPGINATMLYSLDKYFKLPDIPAIPLYIVPKAES